MTPLKTLTVTDRPEWRAWLEQNHANEAGIWLAFHKHGPAKDPLDCESSIEEALCFGWWTAPSGVSTSPGSKLPFELMSEARKWASNNTSYAKGKYPGKAIPDS